MRLELNLWSSNVPCFIAPAWITPVSFSVKTNVPLLMPGGMLEISVYQSTQVSHSKSSAIFARYAYGEWVKFNLGESSWEMLFIAMPRV